MPADQLLEINACVYYSDETTSQITETDRRQRTDGQLMA